ncbi:MAG: hypothetical protein O7D86_08475 [Proteobacteria bacterium]|nr:hypothetical protein [Pseudomonadota bacterium]
MELEKDVMDKHHIIKSPVLNSLLLILLSLSFNVFAGLSFIDALTGGKVDFGVRVRFEHVDDESKASGSRDADALTVRTILGYKTADFYNVFAHVEFENVSDIGDDTQYNDGENGLTTLPTIADARGTDKIRFIYAGEFATQSDTGSNPNDYDADYYLVEGGFKLYMDNFINSLMTKISYEVLESDSGTLSIIIM